MAEKFNLIELNIDTDKVVNDIIDLKKRIEELKEAQRKAKEEFGEGSAEYIKISADLKGLSGELRSTENMYIKVVQAQKTQVGTLQKLAAENARLREEQKKLNLETDEGIKRNKEIVDKINANNEAIMRFSDEQTKGRMSVGQYTKGILEAIPQIGSFTDRLSSARNGLMAFGVTSKFALGPISLLITAITYIVDILRKLDPVMDAIEQGVAALTGAFGVLKDGIVGIFTGTKSLSGAFKDLGTNMRNAAIEAANLKKEQQDLEAQMIIMEETQAKYNVRINELLLKSKDRTKSEKERMALIDEALRLEREAYEQRKTLADKEYENALKQFANKHNLSAEERKRLMDEGAVYAQQLQDKKTISDEEIKSLVEVSKKRYELMNEDISLREKAQNRYNELAEKDKERRQKELEDEKKRKEEIKKMNEELIMYEAELRKRQEEQRQKDLQNILNDLNYQVQLYKATHQKQLDEAKFWSEEDIKIEKERLENIYNQELGYLNTQATLFPEKQNEINLKKIELERQYREQIDAIDAEFAKKRFDKMIIDFENELQARNDYIYLQIDAERQRLEMQRQIELAAAEKTGADVTKINAKYNKLQKDLDKQLFQARLELVSSFANNVAKLFGKATVAGKLAASAQTIVETIKGAQAAFAAAQVIPPPAGQIIGAANAALVVAAGAKSVAEIWSTKSGLPEEGAGGGAGGALTSTAATAGASAAAQTTQQTLESVNGQIGAGIVSRTTAQTNENLSQSIAESMKRIEMQPVLVVDDVTAKQMNKTTQQTLQTV